MNDAARITILALAVVLAGVGGFLVGAQSAPETVIEAPEAALVNVEGKAIPLFPGDTMTLEFEETDKSEIPIVLRDVTGRAKGADLATSIDAFASTFQAGAPEIHVRESYGSATDAVYAAKGLAAKGHMVLIFMGALLIIGGVVVFAYWDKRMGLYAALAGLGLILIGVLLERYPWVALAVPILALAGLGYWWIKSRRAQRVEMALTGVVAGVEAAEAVPVAMPDENGGMLEVSAASVVKKKIGDANAQLKGVVKKVVGDIKASLG